MHHLIDKVLIDRETIAKRVHAMAERIAADFQRETHSDEPLPPNAPLGDRPELTILPIMTGSLIFLADLVRQLPVMMRLRLISVSSYPGTATTSQGPRLRGEIPEDLSGQHLLIVDDILDSGRTLAFVQQLLRERNPASVRTCVLLRKELPSAMKVQADYVGFDIPDEFVVGYGLDYDDYFRNLPEVVTLRPEVLR